MVSGFEAKLDKFAELCIKVGVNIQPGQRLALGYVGHGMYGVPVQLAPLVRQLTKHAYLAGASYVNVLWEDQHIEHIRLQYGSDESLQQYPDWRVKTLVEYQEQGDAVLGIYAQNPRMFKDIPPERLASVTKTASQYVAPFLANTAKGINPRCIMSGATQEWASVVFPEDQPATALQKLWDAIFASCRIDSDDPVDAWSHHIYNLKQRADYLNERQYVRLQYRSSITDLTVGLPRGHIWSSAQMSNKDGKSYVANIPTEEVFTLPAKDQIDGVVSSTKPLNVGGTLIETFRLTFKNGRVVDISADAGVDVLRSSVDTDDGARSLGEVALVPHSSPISQSGVTFYNALFDENASSHFALGNAYRFNLSDGSSMSDTEFAQAGGNQSRIHLDFMIGSGDLDITGINADGTSELVMKDGEWAFSV